MSLIARAERFARKAHSGQVRKFYDPPIPYIVHPERVANLVRGIEGADSPMVAAAWLHDVVEDTSYTYLEIVDEFGLQVANYVIGLTDVSKQCHAVHRLNRAARKQINNIYILNQPRQVKQIKLCDIYDNITDIGPAEDDFKRLFLGEKQVQTELIKDAHPFLAAQILEIISKQLENTGPILLDSTRPV